ncbi:chemotaxis protein CheW [soil metagenome]
MKQSLNQNSPKPMLAVRSAEPTAPGIREFLTFRLGDEEYGIDIQRVQEIRGYEQPTRIANTAAFIKGVINLRGTIVPIVDMRVKFALGEARYDDMTVVIILSIADRVIGMVVDSVSDVLTLAAEQIRAAPDFAGSIDLSYLLGLGSLPGAERDRLLILVDIESLMASSEMALIEQPLPERLAA